LFCNPVKLVHFSSQSTVGSSSGGGNTDGAKNGERNAAAMIQQFFRM
jgi:hypothetical protein